MTYGIASIITPPKTMTSIMGFWNICKTLKDWCGMK